MGLFDSEQEQFAACPIKADIVSAPSIISREEKKAELQVSFTCDGHPRKSNIVRVELLMVTKSAGDTNMFASPIATPKTTSLALAEMRNLKLAADETKVFAVSLPLNGLKRLFQPVEFGSGLLPSISEVAAESGIEESLERHYNFRVVVEVDGIGDTAVQRKVNVIGSGDSEALFDFTTT